MESYTIDPKEVLKRYKVIAVVGMSKNPEKDANTVPAYLMQKGYTIIPVNPTAESILGLKSYPSLLDIPEELARTIDVVEVFRPSNELAFVANQVVELRKKYGRPFVLWAQVGIEDEEAKQVLKKANVDFVMNACMRVVHGLHFT